MRQTEPNITIPDEELIDAGFTFSGNDQYIKSVKDYSKTLFEKAINYAEIDKAKTREVTHDHVKAAAHSIADTFGRPSIPKWMWIIGAGKLVSGALLGFTVNYISQPIGLLGAGFSASIYILLGFIENLKGKL